MAGVPAQSPSVRLRLLGAKLRQLRESLGLTIEEAADLTRRSRASLGKAELGNISLHASEVEYILTKYGVTDRALIEALCKLAARGRRKGWMEEYADVLSPEYGHSIILESDAIEIRTYQPTLVPGWLQRPSYARVVMETLPSVNPERDLDRSIAFRVRRQQALYDDPPLRLDAILDEGVIRRCLGGPEVMHEQLLHLAEVSLLPNVSLQVFPFGAPKHPGHYGAFNTLILGGGLQVVLVDSLTRNDFLEADDWTRRYALVFDLLKESALSEHDSRSLIKEVAAAL